MFFLTQLRHNFVVDSFPDKSTESGNIWDEALHDNAQSPVPDQVCFRVDFPAWRKGYPRRQRKIIDNMMASERTFDLAKRHGLSPARVSQLRREFHNSWQ